MIRFQSALLSFLVGYLTMLLVSKLRRNDEIINECGAAGGIKTDTEDRKTELHRPS
jgi:hypothetical protein